jgi:hypothetical protein
MPFAARHPSVRNPTCRAGYTPMKLRLLPFALLLAALVGAAPRAQAEDIDIFGQVTTDGIKPNVLIVLDTASSNEADFRSTCPIAGIPGDKLMDSVQCAIAVADRDPAASCATR